MPVFLSHWHDSTPKKSPLKRDSNPESSTLEADALPLGQRGGAGRAEEEGEFEGMEKGGETLLGGRAEEEERDGREGEGRNCREGEGKD